MGKQNGRCRAIRLGQYPNTITGGGGNDNLIGGTTAAARNVIGRSPTTSRPIKPSTRGTSSGTSVSATSPARTMRHIVLPLLRPTIIVTALFRLIESVKAFPLIFVMTGGGPGTVTEATNYYAYLQGFNYSLVGFSAAISVVILVAIFAISGVIIRGVGARVDVE